MKNCSNISAYGVLGRYWHGAAGFAPAGPKQAIEIIECKDIRILDYWYINTPVVASIARKGQEHEIVKSPQEWKPPTESTATESSLHYLIISK